MGTDTRVHNTEKCWSEQPSALFTAETNVTVKLITYTLDPAENLRDLWSYCDCKCCVDIYIQMSFSCITWLPAELQLRVQYYREGREWEICVYALICIRCGLLPLIRILTKSHGLYPALYFCTLVWLCGAVLCDQKKPQTPDKHWLHSEQGWDHFIFSLNIFDLVLEVTKFWSSAMREEFKLKLKSPQPEVRC